MEYCLSTVNEFLRDIRAFEDRVDEKRKTSSVGDDSDDQDDEMKADEHSSLATALNINEHVRRFVKQLLHALMSLHELRIVHCDVKGDNIFIANENGHYIVKLGVRFVMALTTLISVLPRTSISRIDLHWTRHRPMVSALEVHRQAPYVSSSRTSSPSRCCAKRQG